MVFCFETVKLLFVKIDFFLASFFSIAAGREPPSYFFVKHCFPFFIVDEMVTHLNLFDFNFFFGFHAFTFSVDQCWAFFWMWISQTFFSLLRKEKFHDFEKSACFKVFLKMIHGWKSKFRYFLILLVHRWKTHKSLAFNLIISQFLGAFKNVLWKVFVDRLLFSLVSVFVFNITFFCWPVQIVSVPQFLMSPVLLHRLWARLTKDKYESLFALQKTNMNPYLRVSNTVFYVKFF